MKRLLNINCYWRTYLNISLRESPVDNPFSMAAINTWVMQINILINKIIPHSCYRVS